MRFSFNVTLLARIDIDAATRVQAGDKLRRALIGSSATLGTIEGKPIVTTIEIEGELDLIDDEKYPERDPEARASRLDAPPLEEELSVEVRRA
jgi:hypothetical protein